MLVFFFINRGMMKRCGGNYDLNDLMEFYHKRLNLDRKYISTYINNFSDDDDTSQFDDICILGSIKNIDEKIDIMPKSVTGSVFNSVRNFIPKENYELVPWFMFDEDLKYEFKEYICYKVKTIELLDMYKKIPDDYVLTHKFVCDKYEIKFGYKKYVLTTEETSRIISNLFDYLNPSNTEEKYIEKYEALTNILKNDDIYIDKFIKNQLVTYLDENKKIYEPFEIVIKYIVENDILEDLYWEINNSGERLKKGKQLIDKMLKVTDEFKIPLDYRYAFELKNDVIIPYFFTIPHIIGTNIMNDIINNGCLKWDSYFLESEFGNIVNDLIDLFIKMDTFLNIKSGDVSDEVVNYFQKYYNKFDLKEIAYNLVHMIKIKTIKFNTLISEYKFNDNINYRLLRAYIHKNSDYYVNKTSDLHIPISINKDFAAFMNDNYENYKDIENIWIQKDGKHEYKIDSETSIIEQAKYDENIIRTLYEWYDSLKLNTKKHNITDELCYIYEDIKNTK